MQDAAMGEGSSFGFNTPPEPELDCVAEPETALVLEDHGVLRRLLRQFEQDARGAPRRASFSMRAALDFFHAHSQMEEAISVKHDHDVLQYLIDMQECTPAGSRLYLSRGLELKRSLEQHMCEEERQLLSAPQTSRLNPRQLARHQACRREAMALLH